MSDTHCYKPVGCGSLVPCCYLQRGHEGPCQPGGVCLAHGEYIGERCPHWPACITDIMKLERSNQ